MLRDPTSSEWRKHWFVLRRPYLYIYNSSAELDEAAVINVSTVRVEQTPEIEQMLEVSPAADAKVVEHGLTRPLCSASLLLPSLPNKTGLFPNAPASLDPSRLTLSPGDSYFFAASSPRDMLEWIQGESMPELAPLAVQSLNRDAIGW